MKILHTSDWHLGHSLYGYDTTSDQLAMLADIENICREEQPDLLLISGDIFDISRPGAGVQKVLADTLLSWRNLFPKMEIIVIAGNHDSASLHEIYSTPWEQLRVHVIGEANQSADRMAERVVVLPGNCIIVPIPYFSERFMPDGYIAQVVKAAVDGTDPSLPIIVMLHTTMSGADFTGHQTGFNDRYIGGIAAISPETIGSDFDYMALGHIHKPQNIADNIRYSGSPRRLSFDENFEHSVTVVKISKRGEKAVISAVAMPEHTPMITIPADGDYASADEIKSLIEDFPDGKTSFVRLNLKAGETLSPIFLAEIRSKLERKGGRLCFVNRQEIHAESSETSREITIESFRSIPPMEIASRFFEAKGNALTDDQREMLQQIIEEVNAEKRK